ncbi:MAG: hypothetical protein M3O41_11960 [Pseudomonadota bacterium]|nr:hypothetical protein [Pseudomonadota bacterium]
MKSKIALHTLALVGAMLFTSAALPAALQSNARPTKIAAERERKHAQTAPTATTPNPDCTLIVPENPLSAAGLATPYELTATDPGDGACHEAEPAQSAFVQAAILDPATGAISIYSPLVIDRGTSPAAAPVVPTLPAGAIVAIWFGYDGTNLKLQAAGDSRLSESHCVNGTAGSLFSQFAYCNASAFFEAASDAVHSAKLKIPPLGTAADGARCPSTRDFFIVDQDQSDNLPTMYLATSSGRTAQDTAANRASLPQASLLGNPSDNRLVDIYVDPVLGCSAWKAPDLADPGQTVAALALNELQARRHQETPVALVPLNDPMAEIGDDASLSKVNAYRAGVDQPRVTADGDADGARYCRQILRIAPARMTLNERALSAAASPDAAAANSLFTFLAQRLVTTYETLLCPSLIHHANPVSVTRDANGVAVTASIDQRALAAILEALERTKVEDDIADAAARTR